METDTCVDPIPAILDFLSGKVSEIGTRVHGEKFPDNVTLPALSVAYIGATYKWVRVQLIIKVACDADSTNQDMATAMGIWVKVDKLLNNQAPNVCGLNSGYTRRDDGSPRQSREKNTDNALVAAYYLFEMGG